MQNENSKNPATITHVVGRRFNDRIRSLHVCHAVRSQDGINSGHRFHDRPLDVRTKNPPQLYWRRDDAAGMRPLDSLSEALLVDAGDRNGTFFQ